MRRSRAGARSSRSRLHERLGDAGTDSASPHRGRRCHGRERDRRARGTDARREPRRRESTRTRPPGTAGGGCPTCRSESITRWRPASAGGSTCSAAIRRPACRFARRSSSQARGGALLPRMPFPSCGGRRRCRRRNAGRRWRCHDRGEARPKRALVRSSDEALVDRRRADRARAPGCHRACRDGLRSRRANGGPRHESSALRVVPPGCEAVDAALAGARSARRHRRCRSARARRVGGRRGARRDDRGGARLPRRRPALDPPRRPRDTPPRRRDGGARRARLRHRRRARAWPHRELGERGAPDRRSGVGRNASASTILADRADDPQAHARIRRHRISRLGPAARQAHGRGSATRRARLGVPGVGEARGRRAHRCRSPCAWPGRECRRFEQARRSIGPQRP